MTVNATKKVTYKKNIQPPQATISASLIQLKTLPLLQDPVYL